MSQSPMSEMAPMNSMNNGMHRQMQENYQYMNNSSLPAHLRQDYSHQLPSQNGQMPPQGGNWQQQMSTRPTSHPQGYGPPQILEPPANQSANGSSQNSPHMSNAGWGSPSSQNHGHGMSSQIGSGMPSPGPNGYMYPDPEYGQHQAMGAGMYYPNSNIRRPQSTEPDGQGYDVKPRINELWQGTQQQ